MRRIVEISSEGFAFYELIKFINSFETPRGARDWALRASLSDESMIKKIHDGAHANVGAALTDSNRTYITLRTALILAVFRSRSGLADGCPCDQSVGGICVNCGSDV